jgi:hypothetical protein
MGPTCAFGQAFRPGWLLLWPWTPVARRWDRLPVPALTLRPQPLPWVAAVVALPAVALATVGGAGLALAAGEVPAAAP